MNPLSTSRNKYHENKKNNIIYTPKNICNFLFNTLSEHIKTNINNGKRIIIDPAVGSANLLANFKESFESKILTIGYDIHDDPNRQWTDIFHKIDFLTLTPEHIKLTYNINEISLVLCNPPFNFNSESKKYRKKLYPELFIKKIFELYGEDTPVVLFSPMGFRLNQRVISKRWKYFRDNCSAEITSIVSLPLDVFPNVEFHNEILLWNIPNLKAHYWLPISEKN